MLKAAASRLLEYQHSAEVDQQRSSSESEWNPERIKIPTNLFKDVGFNWKFGQIFARSTIHFFHKLN